MKAQIVNTQSNAVNYGNKKELVNSWNVIVNSEDGLKNIITARCYMGRSPMRQLCMLVYGCMARIIKQAAQARRGDMDTTRQVQP